MELFKRLDYFRVLSFVLVFSILFIPFTKLIAYAEIPASTKNRVVDKPNEIDSETITQDNSETQQEDSQQNLNEIIGSQDESTQKPSFVILNEGLELSLFESVLRTTDTANEKKETYTLKRDNRVIGYLEYNSYNLKNGDLYYYFRYSPKGAHNEEISILLPYIIERFDLRAVEYPKGLDATKSVITLYNGQTPLDNVLIELKPGTVYIDSENTNCVLSYTSVYKKGEYLTREEIYEDARNIGITTDGIKISLPPIGQGFSEQWGIISSQVLVNWFDKATFDAVRVADLNRIKKWGGDGTYYQLPIGYSPYSINGYYRNNANHVGDKFLRTQGRLFEDFGYITMDKLIQTQNHSGYWATSTRSDWLYRDYKIGAGYFDTRWDTEAALSLLRGYRRFLEPQALEAAITFADFYCDFAMTNSFKTKNGGLLVYDYGFESMPGIKTHVSLNHLLNEMNFLLEMYITTDDEYYLEISKRILTAVRDTSSSWINKYNGDLHYAYLVNGKYGLNDYPTLTLNDLKYSQTLLKATIGEEDSVIKMLIEAKIKYLNKNNIPY